jgi:8-oxo-dGTP pyrophosphatase MutT (NUDIX family)
MKYEKSCGAIVYRKYHGNLQILLIKHVNSGHWSFPKGHVENGETEDETARREIMEETNVDVIIDTTFRETVSYSPKKDTCKVVVYFLARAKSFSYIPKLDEISEVKWVDIDLARNILTYDNDKSIVTKAKSAIKGRMY